MITYELVNELLAYDPVSGDLFWKKNVANNVKAGKIAGRSRSRDRYKILKIHQKQYQAHRIVWLLNYKSFPDKFIDHINGDRTDNRLCNLRQADCSINAQNVRKPSKRNTSGYLGVSYKNGAYEASLTLNKKCLYLGRYHDARLAHEAYLLAKRKYHKGCTI